LSLTCVAGIVIKYSTTIPKQESPISEGSVWTDGNQTGLQWADVATYYGKAWGKEGMQTRANYSDATAVLKGVWNSSHGLAAKVFVTSGAPAEGSPCYPEVELRLHTGIAPNSIKGYEINFSVGVTSKAYAMIVRWNGSLGNFTVLKTAYGSSYGVKNGDAVSATYSNGTITAYKNGVAILSANDSTYGNYGSPGIGFNYVYGSSCPGGPGQNDTYGFSSIAATE
jgi:hypothetical protein